MLFTVRQARKHADLTEDEAADLLGVSKGTYRKYERNPKTMPAGLLDQLLREVGIPLENINLENGLTKIKRGDQP